MKDRLFKLLFPSLVPQDVAKRLNYFIYEANILEKQLLVRYFASTDIYFILGHLNPKIDPNWKLVFIEDHVIAVRTM